MKSKKQKYLDHEPWHKNHPSPMAKLLLNFSLLGFCWFGQKGGIAWFLLFNPAIVLLYISGLIILCITLLFG